METIQDLSSIFQRDVFTPDLYAALKQLAFASKESLDRFLNLLGNIEQRVNAGELKAEAHGLKLGLCYLALGCYDKAIGWLERADRGAEGVGEATTKAVMTSAILILIFDFLIAFLLL